MVDYNMAKSIIYKKRIDFIKENAKDVLDTLILLQFNDRSSSFPDIGNIDGDLNSYKGEYCDRVVRLDFHAQVEESVVFYLELHINLEDKSIKHKSYICDHRKEPGKGGISRVINFLDGAKKFEKMKEEEAFLSNRSNEKMVYEACLKAIDIKNN